MFQNLNSKNPTTAWSVQYRFLSHSTSCDPEQKRRVLGTWMGAAPGFQFWSPNQWECLSYSCHLRYTYEKHMYLDRPLEPELHIHRRSQYEANRGTRLGKILPNTVDFYFFIRLIILEDFIRLISYNGPCVRLGCSFFLATALILMSFQDFFWGKAKPIHIQYVHDGSKSSNPPQNSPAH